MLAGVAAAMAVGMPLAFAVQGVTQQKPATRPALDGVIAIPGLPSNGQAFATGGASALPLAKPPVPSALPQESLFVVQNQAQDAEDDARREQRRLVNAARESAVDRLKRKVVAEPISERLTVADLLKEVDGDSGLRAMLAGSPQLGGPRFPLPGTAEVQLQVRGADVADYLMRLATDAGAASPIDPAELEQRLEGWRELTFHATGGSAAADVALELRLPPDKMPPSWIGVTEPSRQEALLAAQADAVTLFIEAVQDIEVLGEKAGGSTDEQEPREKEPLTLRDVLAEPSVAKETRAYLSRQPYTAMQYGDDRRVEVRLAIDPDDWFDHLQEAMANEDDDVPSIPEERVEQVKAALTQAVTGSKGAAITGVAYAAEPQDAVAGLSLPRRPPEWTRLPLTAQAVVRFNAGAKGDLPLRNAARDQARKDLRAQLDALPVGEGQTLGQLAQLNPAVAAAIATAVNDAPVTRTSWGDSSVRVQVALNPAGLWHSLQRFAASTNGPVRGQVAPPPEPE